MVFISPDLTSSDHTVTDGKYSQKMDILLELNFKQELATRIGTLIFGLIVFCFVNDNAKLSLLLGALLALMTHKPSVVYALVTTIRRDLIAFQRFFALNVYLYVVEQRNWSIARIFQQRVRAHPNKSCFIMDDKTMTFLQVECYSNKIAAYFQQCGLRRGDCVAVILDTRPEYPCLWLGLSKIGVVAALINTNLRRETLLHSIKVANAKAIVVGTELVGALKEILHNAEVQNLAIYQYSDQAQRASEHFELIPNAVDFTKVLETQNEQDMSAEISKSGTRDKLMYVYTSGTTGLPKAAVITNLRYLFMSSGAYHMLAIKSGDVIYNPLPLYHTAGGIVGIGNALLNGSTVVLRKKFSASNFWKDCIKYECSVAQYIGELCRYLLATPIKPEDKQHRIRLMYGNGLRPQIWTQFITRFNIPQIGEVYGATEGNSNLANITNRVGAIGFVPILGRRLYPVQVIKCDDETGEPLRDKHGRCIRCKCGEPGLLIGQVDPRRAVSAFNGYADKDASEKKLLRDVFCKGDVYFNSGDMIVGDILGYFYFKDRTGDTFRWRGENVATQEVEAIITNVVGLSDCVVYGVDIPYVEGKAGMAAIVDPERKVDMEYLSVGIRGSLPAYARPLFIRLMNEIPRTATFKMKKRDLVLDAFNITKLNDPIYYLNSDGIYRPLTMEQYEALQTGQAGL